MPQSLTGFNKYDLDTPVLCIDLDRMEENIRKMGQLCRAHGVQWRPHEKCHKTPAIAHLEVAAGALGGGGAVGAAGPVGGGGRGRGRRRA
ncbi:MAG: hypothetical protein ACK5EA_05085, partial [Planctomycetaceae bacterium]